MKNGACTFRRRYLKVSTISYFAALLSFGEAAATPADTTLDRLLDVCEASTVQEAMVNGDKLDWQRLSNADIEEWRRNFVGYNGGSVDLVGWRHERKAEWSYCRSGLPLVLMDVRHARLPRQGLPVSWMHYRSGLEHQTISTRMMR